MRRFMAWLLAALIILPAHTWAAAQGNGVAEMMAGSVGFEGMALPEVADWLQPQDAAFEGGALRLEMHEALLVDGLLSAAWTLENTGVQTLCVFSDVTVDGEGLSGYSFHDWAAILEPGETMACGVALYMEDWQWAQTGETAVLDINTAGLLPLGTLVTEAEAIPRDIWRESREPLEREAERLFQEEGKLVTEERSQRGLLLGLSETAYTRESELPAYAQMFLRAGKAARHSLVHGQVRLRADRAEKDAMPEGAVRAPVRGGMMQLARAVVSPLGLAVEAAFVFPDEASAYAFHDPNNGNEPAPMTLEARDGAPRFAALGSFGYARGEGGQLQEPERLPDGQFVWPYRIRLMYRSGGMAGCYLVIDDGSRAPGGEDGAVWISFGAGEV